MMLHCWWTDHSTSVGQRQRCYNPPRQIPFIGLEEPVQTTPASLQSDCRKETCT